ncbi:DUF4184 family protein [Streptomyces kunmingensis]|uniref:DUF4184 family protein n=1 Tax=Streptomyces kunmingensis TaxID=68225 RepID=A0ABU6C2E5_9ACTN|nr:DUF4184 family protein [Streptomyces kunmingensis]MEB3958699.1 DUF4184 family protein [Streptomyces kunmingensis]
MPFTLSHPAAVLPLLRRRPLAASALIAGSLAPDMPYFAASTGIPVNAQSWYEPLLNATTSHSPAGMVTVALPYALTLYGLQRALRRPLKALLPSRAPDARSQPVPPPPRERETSAGGGWRSVLWVPLSLLIGIATHLVWDSFTHGDGYAVSRLALLRDPLVGDLTWARALQHVSTVAGLAALAVHLWRRRPRPDGHGGAGRPASRRVRATRWTFALIAIAGIVDGGRRNLADAHELTRAQAAESLLSGAAKEAGAVLIAALLLYAVVWWSRQARTAL